MSEPKPIALVALTALALVGWLVLWWVHLPEGEQRGWLQAIARWEQAQTPPPVALWAQPGWLWRHRVPRLRSLTVLVALGAVIGLGEGWAWRRTDPLQGLRLTLWSTGLVLAVLVGCAGVAFLVLPWPLPRWMAAGVGALVSSGAGFMLSAGRPSTP